MFDPLGHVTCQEDIAGLLHLIKLIDAATVVEVGTWAGGTAIAMAEAHPYAPNTIFCVDTWEGNPDDRLGFIAKQYGREKIYGTFLKNCQAHLFNTIMPCVGTSKFWAKHLRLEVDLVFIDADHRYENVKEDIRLWAPHVRKGGIICGHDYGEFPGVTKVVDEFRKDGLFGLTVWWKQL